MCLGAISAVQTFQHIGLRHVQAAVFASLHGTGLERCLALRAFRSRAGRVVSLFFLFFLERIQTIFAP